MADTELRVRLQHAYHTEAEWALIDTIPLEGEILYTKDLGSTHHGWCKIGDGVNTWSDLPYINQASSGVLSVVTGDTNGTIKVNTGGVVTNVSVYGLGSAAFTNTTDYVSQSVIDQVDASKAPLEQGVEFIKGTQSSSTAAWTGETTSVNLYDGKQIAYYLPYINVDEATLNLTLSNEENTGAKPVYLYGTTRLTNQFPAESIIRMTWDATKQAWIVDAEYLGDTFEGIKVSNTSWLAGQNGIQQNSLFMEDGNGSYQSFTTDDGTGTDKTKNTAGFRLPYIYYNNSSSSYTNGQLSLSDIGFISKEINIKYSTNISSLTTNKPVYLVGTLGSDGLFYLSDTWWSQTLPNTEDGKLYVYLGHAYSTSAICLLPDHPIFYYMGGRVNQWFGPNATPTINGQMSAADKDKLDTVERNANYYILPVATDESLGGVMAGDDISVLQNGLMQLNTFSYDFDYELTSTTATFTARLYRGTQDVTNLYDLYHFSWYKKTEGGLLYLGKGPTLTITLADMGFFGTIIGRWSEEGIDIAFATDNNEQLVTSDGDILITT